VIVIKSEKIAFEKIQEICSDSRKIAYDPHFLALAQAE